MLVMKNADPEGIAKLRNLQVPEQAPITVEQLTSVIRWLLPDVQIRKLPDSVKHLSTAATVMEAGDGRYKVVPEFTDPRPLADVAAETGMSSEEILDLIVAFGTQIGQRAKENQEADLRPAAGVQHVFFSYMEAVEATGQTFPPVRGVLPDGSGYVILVGLDRASTGRNLENALRRIVTSDPTEAEIRRYLIRRFSSVTATPTWGVVQAVHRFASQGMLDMIDGAIRMNASGDPAPKLGKLIVDTYDMLDVSRERAVAAVDRLCKAGKVLPTLTGADLDSQVEAVVADAHRARFLGEADIDRVIRASRGEDPWLLIRELQMLDRKVQANRDGWMPAHIGLLNEGQVKRIAMSFGIVCERLSPAENQLVRTTITSAGLRNDLDELASVGVRSLSLGLFDVFESAVTARAEGRIDWDAELNARISEVTAAWTVREPVSV